MISDEPWKPIDSYTSNSFDPHQVWVRAEGHDPVKAEYGWDEEHYDGWDDAWHIMDDINSYLPFQPEEWCELDEYEAQVI